jgi:hypothetical protein
MIREALYRESNFKHQVVTKFHQKPPQNGSIPEEEGMEANEMEVDQINFKTFEDYKNEYDRCLY